MCVHVCVHFHSCSSVWKFVFTSILWMCVFVYSFIHVFAHVYSRLITFVHVHICDRLWENGAFGADNKNVDFNLF